MGRADAETMHGPVTHGKIPLRRPRRRGHRRAHQLAHHTAVADLLESLEHVLIGASFGFKLVHHLSYANVGAVGLRCTGCGLQPGECAPRMRHQPDLLFAEAIPQVVSHRQRVGYELLQRHRFWRDTGTVGETSAALFPPDHREVSFQARRYRRKKVFGRPPCRNSSTGCAGSVLWMNIPCRAPLISAKTFSEPRPRSGRPSSSGKRFDPRRPGRFSSPTRNEYATPRSDNPELCLERNRDQGRGLSAAVRKPIT